MAVILDIRNPLDLTTTYDKIEIQRSTTNTVAGMANITTNVSIDTATASDLSSGYTTYTDADGTEGTHYYRFRFKNSVNSAVSSYSDIFLAGGSVLQTRFRRMMRDTNSNNYFFNSDDLKFFEEQSIEDLWPITWFETYSDSFFTADGATEVFTWPIGTTRVNSIDRLDTNGRFIETLKNWRVRGRVLIFDAAPSTGYTYRVWHEKMFLKLAEVPAIWDTYILNLMRLRAYETLEADRGKFYKYNAVAKPEGGNLASINAIITRLEQQIRLRENKLRRVRRPAFMRLV